MKRIEILFFESLAIYLLLSINVLMGMECIIESFGPKDYSSILRIDLLLFSFPIVVLVTYLNQLFYKEESARNKISEFVGINILLNLNIFMGEVVMSNSYVNSAINVINVTSLSIGFIGGAIVTILRGSNNTIRTNPFGQILTVFMLLQVNVLMSISYLENWPSSAVLILNSTSWTIGLVGSIFFRYFEIFLKSNSVIMNQYFTKKYWKDHPGQSFTLLLATASALISIFSSDIRKLIVDHWSFIGKHPSNYIYVV